MLTKTTEKPETAQLRLFFNIEEIDRIFPGFTLGNFAVLYGSPSILSLSTLLCTRAQLPYELGGLETDVVFVDGGNTFRLYNVSYASQLHRLDPRQVLERILISRAFTAYQMTSLVFEKLEEIAKKYHPKLVMISDIARLYLDKDIPEIETRNVFNQLTIHLRKFAEENKVIVIATYLPSYQSRRDTFFRAVACGRANVVASLKPSKCGQRFALEKHPFFSLGSVYLPPEKPTLTEFMGA